MIHCDAPPGPIIPTHAHEATHEMGTPADTAGPGQPPFIPDLDRILAAGQAHGTRFFPDFSWPEEA